MTLVPVKIVIEQNGVEQDLGEFNQGICIETRVLSRYEQEIVIIDVASSDRIFAIGGLDHGRIFVQAVEQITTTTRACDCEPINMPDGTLSHRAFCSSKPTRDERRADRRKRCARGEHEDPDHSGLCIHCSAVLYGDDER